MFGASALVMRYPAGMEGIRKCRGTHRQLVMY